MKSKTLITALALLTTLGCGTDTKDSEGPSQQTQRRKLEPQKTEEKESVKKNQAREANKDRQNPTVVPSQPSASENEPKMPATKVEEQKEEITVPSPDTEAPQVPEISEETEAPVDTAQPSDPPMPEPVETLDPLEPVSNLRCPEMYDNRVQWSSDAKEFFAAVGTAQNPPKSCQDGRNPYTPNKEALLPAETGFYQIKVCAYDSSNPDRISTEKSISCSIQF